MECWNNGIMGSGIMQYWVNGKICVHDRIKTGEYPSKTNLPAFHYSIFEASIKPQKTSYIFIKL
jgi:hypothetical protein